MAWSLRIEREDCGEGRRGDRRLVLRTARRACALSLCNEWSQLRHECRWWTWTLVRVWAEKETYLGEGVWEGGAVVLGLGVQADVWSTKENGEGGGDV